MSQILSVFVPSYLLSCNNQIHNEELSQKQLFRAFYSVTRKKDKSCISKFPKRPCLESLRFQRNKGLKNFPLFFPSSYSRHPYMQGICHKSPQWMPEIADGTKPYIYYVFFHTHACMHTYILFSLINFFNFAPDVSMASSLADMPSPITFMFLVQTYS